MRTRREANILFVSVAASMLIFAEASAEGLDSVYPTTSQEDEAIMKSDETLNSTTKCTGFGAHSESAAEAQISSNGNNIIQQCEQTISSADGNGSNIATNTVQGNNNEGGNKVNQQSKQKIDN